MRTIILPVIFVIFFLCGAGAAYSGIAISTDHRSIFFGLMESGQEKELAEFGTYHNQITCSSTNGYAWYLKISVLGPLASGAEMIPLENFKWKLAFTDGVGTVPNLYEYKAFNVFPELVYISGPDEATGRSVRFQFKYNLSVPEIQVSGNYNTRIRFTLTEVL